MKNILYEENVNILHLITKNIMKNLSHNCYHERAFRLVFYMSYFVARPKCIHEICLKISRLKIGQWIIQTHQLFQCLHPVHNFGAADLQQTFINPSREEMWYLPTSILGQDKIVLPIYWVSLKLANIYVGSG